VQSINSSSQALASRLSGVESLSGSSALVALALSQRAQVGALLVSNATLGVRLRDLGIVLFGVPISALPMDTVQYAMIWSAGSVSYDPLNSYSATSGEFKAPARALYLLSAGACSTAAGATELTLALYVQNQFVRSTFTSPSPGTGISAQITTHLLLQAGDRVAIKAQLSPGGTGSGWCEEGHNTWWSIAALQML
jgi:hypothetical protein